MKRTVEFKDGFKGKLVLDEGEVLIGATPDVARPYDLLYGALAGCLYVTFLEIAEKKRLVIDSCTIVVDAKKREEVPMMLKTVHLIVKINTEAKESLILKSFDLACKYCSIFQTISHVATVTYEIEVINT